MTGYIEQEVRHVLALMREEKPGQAQVALRQLLQHKERELSELESQGVSGAGCVQYLHIAEHAMMKNVGTPHDFLGLGNHTAFGYLNTVLMEIEKLRKLHKK